MTDYTTFTAVDLSRLPAPTVIEALSYETILQDMRADLQARLGAAAFDALVESDPAIAVLEVAAYREFLLRGRVNDAARAVMPAYATGADLDQLAALMSVTRLLIEPADPVAGTAAVYESDADLRRRLVLAPEGYSVAGPEGAYVFHALSADPDVLDASATSPAPGEVVVTVLSRVGDGGAAGGLIDTVAAHLSAETRRPMTDQVSVQSAEILAYQVEADLYTFAGPDSSIVLAQAQAGLARYVAASHRLGRDVTLSGLYAALHVEGVQRVDLVQPEATIPADRTQATWCIGTAVQLAGLAE